MVEDLEDFNSEGSESMRVLMSEAASLIYANSFGTDLKKQEIQAADVESFFYTVIAVVKF